MNKRYFRKAGREKTYKTPDLLLKAAFEYFDHIDADPWYKHEPMKSGEMTGKTMLVPTARPYSIKGLCVFLGFSENYWHKMRKADSYSDFTDVFDYIEDIIRAQQFEGAVVGAFNASIISRMLGIDRLEPTPLAGLNLSVIDKETLKAVKTIKE